MDTRPSDDSRFERVDDGGASHESGPAAADAADRLAWLARGRRRLRRGITILVRVAIPLVAAWLVLNALSAVFGSYLWFRSVGFGDVWLRQFGYGTALFAVGLLGTAILLLANLLLAWHLSEDPTDATVAAEGRRRSARATGEAWLVATANLPRRPVRLALVFVVLAAALVAGVLLSGAWQTVALWLHQVPYAASGPTVADPVFGFDLGWWLFALPLLHLAATVAAALLAASIALSAVAYAMAAIRGADVTRRGPILHGGLLVALLLLVIAAIQWLGRYDLAYAQNGFVTGVGATDSAVRLPLAAVTTLATVLAAVAVVLVAILRDARLARRVGLVGGTVYLVLLAAGAVLPLAYQKLVVQPSQNSAEAQPIANNIAMTRRGFALDTWSVQPDPGRANLTAADVAGDQATFDNVRLWDARPLAATLDQLQTLRPYYTFTSVNIDRYVIDGTPTEVMLSAREMALDKLRSTPTWVASHIVYTHGYGVTMLPVNAVDPDGLPHLIVQNLPVTSTPGAPVVTQPRVYFGQRPSTWVLVDGRSAEFDYPPSTGGSDTQTRYSGSGGVAVGSIPERLFWAWNLGDLNLAISSELTSRTRLLLHRSLTDRVGTLAPFLALDGDPYMVIAPDGHLVYVQDAYTITSAMPDSTAFTDASLGATYDYIRNSVKVTVDAYDGTVHFYVADAADPLIRAWEGVLPGMFEPLSAMPAGLAAHLRTPESMFNAQTQTYATYHVTDVSSFYRGDNVWTLPTVTTGGTQVLAPQAYYVEIRLPGASGPEFVLVQPMVPASRPNMIAWVAARNDGAARGQVIVYELPSSGTIQGPTQIEARIDQNPTISAQLSLWNQSGSRVIRGSLLVIPVGASFVYIEPVYLQSTSTAFPQLTKVVVASEQSVAWGDTLGQALQAVLSGTGTSGQAPPSTGLAGPDPGLIATARGPASATNPVGAP